MSLGDWEGGGTLHENQEIDRGQAAVRRQEEREDLRIYFGTCCISGVSEIAKGGVRFCRQIRRESGALEGGQSSKYRFGRCP